MRIILYALAQLVPEEPGLLPVAPAKLLSPGRQEAVVDSLFGNYLHIAGNIGMTGKTEIQHSDNGVKSAAGVSRPGSCVALCAGIYAGGVYNGASARVIGKALLHLLYIDNGVYVMYLVVKILAAPKPVGVVVCLEGAVQLKSGGSVVAELFQMVEPGHIAHGNAVHILGAGKMRVKYGSTLKGILLTQLLCPLTALTLLLKQQIVVLTEPKAEFEAHLAQIVEECIVAAVILRHPVREEEAIAAPCFVNGAVIVICHPLRLKSHHIAGNVLAAEIQAVVQHLPRICLLVKHESIAVRKLGKQYGIARNLALKRKDVRKLSAFGHKQVKVYLPLVGGNNKAVRVRGTAVKGSGVGAVKQQTPAVGGHNKGYGAVGRHISDVKACHGAAAGNVLA